MHALVAPLLSVHLKEKSHCRSCGFTDLLYCSSENDARYARGETTMRNKELLKMYMQPCYRAFFLAASLFGISLIYDKI